MIGDEGTHRGLGGRPARSGRAAQRALAAPYATEAWLTRTDPARRHEPASSRRTGAPPIF